MTHEKRPLDSVIALEMCADLRERLMHAHTTVTNSPNVVGPGMYSRDGLADYLWETLELARKISEAVNRSLVDGLEAVNRSLVDGLAAMAEMTREDIANVDELVSEGFLVPSAEKPGCFVVTDKGRQALLERFTGESHDG